MNKQGDEKILIMYWFAVITIVAVAVVSMTFIFYKSRYDIQGVEAKILSDRIADCIVQGGITQEFFFDSDFQQRFSELCKIDFGTESEKYFVRISLYDFDSCSREGGSASCSKILREVSSGNNALDFLCAAQLRRAKGDLPTCTQRWIYALGALPEQASEKARERAQTIIPKEQFMIRITSIVNKIHENR
jgi:hypothetical protein